MKYALLHTTDGNVNCFNQKLFDNAWGTLLFLLSDTEITILEIVI